VLDGRLFTYRFAPGAEPLLEVGIVQVRTFQQTSIGELPLIVTVVTRDALKEFIAKGESGVTQVLSQAGDDEVALLSDMLAEMAETRGRIVGRIEAIE
jgi:hypothetical protein